MFDPLVLQQTSSDQSSLQSLKKAISDNYCVDENRYVESLLSFLALDSQQQESLTQKTRMLVEQIRKNGNQAQGVEAFLQEYSLDTEEGIVLMCLAEALLRIPDTEVANQLIRDKIGGAAWDKHVGQSPSKLVNASTWGLMLTGRIIDNSDLASNFSGTLKKMLNRCGEPVIRSALNQAMKYMGKQFVLGRTIEEATQRAKSDHVKGYTHSFDMLGEAAFTQKDANRYYDAYFQAISTIGKLKVHKDTPSAPSISIKLSALHPRYEANQSERVMTELADKMIALIEHAKAQDVAMTIDAEEADRLEISLELFEFLFKHPCTNDWNALGLVVQAYSKRALPVLVWLNKLAQENRKPIPLRLVKGAYWDSEIKWAQEKGLPNYPVYTRKACTDVSYLACAKYLLSHPKTFYPQFATHNAQTVMSIFEMAGESRHFEFQKLHGMGEALYDEVLKHQKVACRIYAPVGQHKELLPYLVRRLLENGANTSFVHRLVDPNTPVMELAKHPATLLREVVSYQNPQIPLPTEIYGESRANSNGINLLINSQSQPFLKRVESFLDQQWHATGLINGQPITGDSQQRFSPNDTQKNIGSIINVSEAQVNDAINIASAAQHDWNAQGVHYRADCLRRAADLLETHKHELIAICCLEGGKTLEDGIDEVREAIDFCRYYANQAEQNFKVITLPGPTGELNELRLEGRGVFSCISPWNFPLAIFLGQVTAALVAGNTVLAKPAQQTPIIAWRAIQLLLEAGIPDNVLHFLPGKGSIVGRLITEDQRIAGVAFTGSTATAMHINQTLAARQAQIAPFIAETGGQNVMLADSTALPEQVVEDVIRSAFTSAGQRCSALRILYVQEEIADRVLSLLKGAMQELTLGEPHQLNTDIGPVIDEASRQELLAHIQNMESQGRLIARTPLPDTLAQRGYYIAPTALRIRSIHNLKQEFFGPILHVVTYEPIYLDEVINEINAYGYGLTFGVHTRNTQTAAFIDQNIKVGNVYINRNMIGATVGVQPFGGQGLSGTGPKAGGPHYLYRFATEHTRTNNTAAVGGNATLLSLGDQ
ncbi:MAG: bifunctional proline dehydrogenase/L-glutamate gamma-semialdehyde dehydrogenase PutA [Pseudomonadota bacterium]